MTEFPRIASEFPGLELASYAPGIQEVRFPGWAEPRPVMVSVVVQTYQHESYIAQCLESIVGQQTKFDFEVLVGEDNSNDNTRPVCMEYSRKHPEKIRLLLHDRSNMIRIRGTPTGRFNLLTNFARAQGRYIAICEGDDYWNDPRKLQKQVELLEADRSLSGSFHLVDRVDGKGKIVRAGSSIRRKVSRLTMDEVLGSMQGCPLHTCSLMFRRELLDRGLPAWIQKIPMADWPLVALAAEQGPLVCVRDVMAAYRVHPGGLWSALNEFKKIRQRLDFFKRMKQHFGDAHREQTDFGISWHRWLIAEELSKQGRHRLAGVMRRAVLKKWNKTTARIFYRGRIKPLLKRWIAPWRGSPTGGSQILHTP